MTDTPTDTATPVCPFLPLSSEDDNCPAQGAKKVSVTLAKGYLGLATDTPAVRSSGQVRRFYPPRFLPG